MTIQLAQWDTDHFGMKIGTLSSEEDFSESDFLSIIENARNEGYQLLYGKGITVPKEYLGDDVFLADEKVVYSQFVKNNRTVASANVISLLKTSLSAQALSLALQSGGHSRYYQDKHFSINVFITLYKEWIERSLSGEIATDVLGYLDGTKLLGILTYKIEDNIATIGLVAVDDKATGKGVGTKLMQSFLSNMPDGIIVNVATQKCNDAACHFYEKNGFLVDSITNIYHIWL